MKRITIAIVFLAAFVGCAVRPCKGLCDKACSLVESAALEKECVKMCYSEFAPTCEAFRAHPDVQRIDRLLLMRVIFVVNRKALELVMDSMRAPRSHYRPRSVGKTPRPRLAQ
jgi:hypothetical protein